jgi:endonuclease III
MFELHVFGSGDPAILRKIQNLLLYCGFNLFTNSVAYAMGFAYRIIHEFKGRIPSDKRVLATFYGIGDKVANLQLQDTKPLGVAGLVTDSHVCAAGKNLKWAVRYNTPALVGKEIESWLHYSFYKKVNESIAGLRQLWGDIENKEVMEEVAKELGIARQFATMVKGVRQIKNKKK